MSPSDTIAGERRREYVEKREGIYRISQRRHLAAAIGWPLPPLQPSGILPSSDTVQA